MFIAKCVLLKYTRCCIRGGGVANEEQKGRGSTGEMGEVLPGDHQLGAMCVLSVALLQCVG